jgi:membrane protease YdiL (CAAX protease family)
MHGTVTNAQAAAGGQHDAGGRLRRVLLLIGAIWTAGLLGHVTAWGEWPALFIYVLGSLALAITYCAGHGAWLTVGITRHGLRRALLWGGMIGGGLMLLDWVNTWLYYRAGNPPMVEMESILVDRRLILLFPVLVLAEEFLWRGMALSALRDAGWNRHLAVALTTLAYALNHFAVAPVSMLERGMMAAMALPIGILGGYLVWRLRNVWAAVAVHMLTFVSMTVDIFVIPNLVAAGGAATG